MPAALKNTFGAVVVAIKDDFCLEESLVEVFTQGVTCALIVSPEFYWADGAKQTREDLERLKTIAVRTGAAIVSAHFKSRERVNEPVHTEAIYRNFGIEQLIKEHPAVNQVVTVDADELWSPGTLAEVDELADGETVVCMPSIPVIGVPGLPVEGAKDTILIASPAVKRFAWGRSIAGKRKTGNVPVIHFSATRRTLDEVALKSRQSAHYCDPSYAFERWINGTLKNVCVGSKDVHMYTGLPNIWPKVRAWTHGEWDRMPESLKRFLAVP